MMRLERIFIINLSNILVIGVCLIGFPFEFKAADDKPIHSFRAPSMLSRYSLEAYCPEIGDQGDVGSCVGWAATYYGFTIVKRVEFGQDYPVFSPLSTYNRYCFFYHKNPCYGGAQIDGSLEVLKKYGSPLLSDYTLPNCAHDPDKTKYPNRLFDYEHLQHKNVNQIKAAISKNRPVVIGMNVYAGGKGNSLNTKFLDSNGVIKIENFNSDYAVAGHAMCIIGYDDDLGGGAFKLVNSWGKEWGKSGFCWLRYKDLDILRAAYALIPNDELSASSEGLFKTKAIEWLNSTSENLYLSYGISTNEGDQQARGWFYIPSGSSRAISIAPRSSNDIYFVLMNEEGKVHHAEGKTIKMPSDNARFFDYKTKKEGKAPIETDYFSFSPKNKKRVQRITITGTQVPKISD
jgi:hypothetical protein